MPTRLWHHLLAQQPIYHIRGTVSSGTTDISFDINGVTVTIPCDNDSFDYEYRTPLTSLCITQDSASPLALLTFDCSAADDFSHLNSAAGLLRGCNQCTSVILSNTTFSNVVDISYIFYDCSRLTSVVGCSYFTFASVTNADSAFQNAMHVSTLDFSAATFAQLQSAVSMFRECWATTVLLTNATFAQLSNANGMFYAFRGTTINLSSTTFATVTNAQRLFSSCGHLTTIVGSNHFTFASVTNANYMFNGTAFTTLDLSAATFAAVTSCSYMFQSCASLQSVDLSAATFAALNASVHYWFKDCTSLRSITLNATFSLISGVWQMFYGCTALVDVHLPNATFASLASASAMFQGCTSLQTVEFGPASLTSSTTTSYMFAYTDALMNFTATANTLVRTIAIVSPSLTAVAIQNIVNWLADLTGQTSQRLTLGQTAWNNLTAAQQTNFTAIVNAKNWTLVLN